MTTVTYRNGVMAADTMMVRYNEPCYGAEKIFRTDKYMVGIAGAYSAVLPFKDMLESLPEDRDPSYMWKRWECMPELDGGFSATIVDREGSIWSCMNEPPVPFHGEFDAIGSGAPYAIGAMAIGASAIEALIIADRFDINTGGLHVTQKL